jgi:hypothetical protein
MKRILDRVTSLPLAAHIGAASVAFVGFHVMKARLDESYAASGHPVDYATGQLAFDASVIEGYYRVMQEAGTLEIYVRTQIIDFGFIAAIMVLSVLLGTLAARLNGAGWGRRLGLWAAGAGVIGAISDALENLASFVMLAQPDAIAQPVSLIYSSFAAAKFTMLTLAMALFMVSLIAAVIGGAVRRLRSA